MFPPRTRVNFFTTHGPCQGVVLEVLPEHIDGDYVHRVQPDDGGDVLLMLGRCLTSLENAPFIVAAG